MKSTNTPPNLGYVPSLDGLRGFALIFVLLLHANFKLAISGGLGLSIFFALSGFLITTLLLEEFNKNGDISFKGFYIRRTMRLFPPLYAMLAFVFVYALIFRTGTDQQNIFQDIISAALYIYNIAWYWGWSVKEILLYHTWSLGVEEQFYLLWPLVLYFFLKKKKIRILQVALLLFIATTLMLKSLHLFPYLADSIIKESIFIGCATALLRWTGFLKPISSVWATVLLVIIFFVGMLPFKIPYYDVFFNVFSIFSSFIILHFAYNPNSMVSKVFSNKALVFLGKISYSLYLWHLPVFRIFAYHSTLPPLVSFAGKFIVSLILAVASWYTVEKATTAFGRRISKKITDHSIVKV